MCTFREVTASLKNQSAPLDALESHSLTPQGVLKMSVDVTDPTPTPASVDVVLTKKRFVGRIVLIVLTLALWKGWAEENHFLDVKVAQENQMLNSNSSNSFIPSFDQHVAEVNERENRYREREGGQPLKLIPIALWTLFAGWLAIAPKAKVKLDVALEALNTASKSKMTVLAICGGAVSIIGAWFICGHANTGAFCGMVVGGYLYWLGRQKVT
jgi:hypothetical protein